MRISAQTLHTSRGQYNIAHSPPLSPENLTLTCGVSMASAALYIYIRGTETHSLVYIYTGTRWRRFFARWLRRDAPRLPLLREITIPRSLDLDHDASPHECIYIYLYTYIPHTFAALFVARVYTRCTLAYFVVFFFHKECGAARNWPIYMCGRLFFFVVPRFNCLILLYSPHTLSAASSSSSRSKKKAHIRDELCF